MSPESDGAFKLTLEGHMSFKNIYRTSVQRNDAQL